MKYELKFAPRFIRPILGLQKDESLRLFEEVDLGPEDEGAPLKLVEAHENTQFGYGIFEQGELVTAEWAARQDFDGHRNYDSPEDCTSSLGQYYEQDIDVHTPLLYVKLSGVVATPQFNTMGGR